eukprot:PITA_10813
MVEEYDFIVRNSVWDVVPRLEDNSVLSSQWLYKVNKVADGSAEKHKGGVEDTSNGCKDIFLNGTIEEEMYIEQPEVFETFDRDSHVCRLKRALYGLKQEPRAWYTRIDNYFTGLGFTKSEAYENLYHIVVEVNQLSQETIRPTNLYWKVEKHVLRYLRGTSQYGLWYRRTEGVKLQGFIDAEWVGSPSNQKSTSRGIFSIRSVAVSWYNRKLRSVARSSAEAEYMAASQATCEAI